MAKTNSWLVKYAKAQVGKPYWFGSYGQTATESLYNSLKKSYPSYYTATDFTSQYGKKVHDCSGIVKGALWCDTTDGTPEYKSSQDKNAASMYSACTDKGSISSFPKKSGQLVFRGTSASAIHHVGVYDNGYVYEAKGHAYGVEKTSYAQSEWDFWGQHPDFTDDSSTSNSSTSNSTITEIAYEVINGDWGNGDNRKKKLMDAGYDYDAVQAEVNKILGSSSSSSSSKSSTPTYTVGKTYTTQVNHLAVRTGAGTSYSKKTRSQLTSDGQKHAYSDGCLEKGTTVTCKATKIVGNDVWMEIPSGWVAAYYNESYYVK